MAALATGTASKPDEPELHERVLNAVERGAALAARRGVLESTLADLNRRSAEAEHVTQAALTALPAGEDEGQREAAETIRARTTCASVERDRITRDYAALAAELRGTEDEVLRLAAEVRPVFRRLACTALAGAGLATVAELWGLLDELADAIEETRRAEAELVAALGVEHGR